MLIQPGHVLTLGDGAKRVVTKVRSQGLTYRRYRPLIDPWWLWLRRELRSDWNRDRPLPCSRLVARIRHGDVAVKMDLCSKGDGLLLASNAIFTGREKGEKTTKQLDHIYMELGSHLIDCEECQKDPLARAILLVSKPFMDTP